MAKKSGHRRTRIRCALLGQSLTESYLCCYTLYRNPSPSNYIYSFVTKGRYFNSLSTVRDTGWRKYLAPLSLHHQSGGDINRSKHEHFNFRVMHAPILFVTTKKQTYKTTLQIVLWNPTNIICYLSTTLLYCYICIYYSEESSYVTILPKSVHLAVLGLSIDSA